MNQPWIYKYSASRSPDPKVLLIVPGWFQQIWIPSLLPIGASWGQELWHSHLYPLVEAGTQQVLQNVWFKCSVPAVLLKTAAQKAHQVKTAINLKPLPTVAPQDEFAYYQFRDMKLKGRHFRVELVTTQKHRDLSGPQKMKPHSRGHGCTIWLEAQATGSRHSTSKAHLNIYILLSGIFRVHIPAPNPNTRKHFWKLRQTSSIQFSSVAQSCPTLCDSMDCSTPGFPVHHQLLEFTQTHLHWVGDAIQLSHPLSPPSSPAFSLSQHQGLFQWVSSSHQVAKVLEFQLQHQCFQWTLRTDLL